MPLKPDTLAMTVVLALLTALGPLSTDMYLPSLPAIRADLGATTAGTQLTLSAFLLGFAVGQFVYGPVSDRVGRRPVLLFRLALFTLASLICTLAPSIETLVAARFVQAIGASGPIVLGRAIVRDLYEGARAGRELSRMSTIMGLPTRGQASDVTCLPHPRAWRHAYLIQDVARWRQAPVPFVASWTTLARGARPLGKSGAMGNPSDLRSLRGS